MRVAKFFDAEGNDSYLANTPDNTELGSNQSMETTSTYLTLPKCKLNKPILRNKFTAEVTDSKSGPPPLKGYSEINYTDMIEKNELFPSGCQEFWDKMRHRDKRADVASQDNEGTQSATSLEAIKTVDATTPISPTISFKPEVKINGGNLQRKKVMVKMERLSLDKRLFVNNSDVTDILKTEFDHCSDVKPTDQYLDDFIDAPQDSCNNKKRKHDSNTGNSYYNGFATSKLLLIHLHHPPNFDLPFSYQPKILN